MLLQMAGFHSFYGWVVFHCVYIPHLFNPIICWWALTLLSYLGNCKYAAMNIACIFWNQYFHFLWIYIPRSGITESYGSSIFSFLRKLHTVFIVATQIYIPTNSIGGLLFSTSFPTFVICRHFNDSHSKRYEFILHCGFDLHSLIMCDVEHIFISLLAICMSSLVNFLFRSSVYFFFCLSFC